VFTKTKKRNDDTGSDDLVYEQPLEIDQEVQIQLSPVIKRQWLDLTYRLFCGENLYVVL